MTDERWPQFPQDQLMLPDLGSDPPRRDEDDAAPKRPSATSSRPQFYRPCRVCGQPKLIGLPCPCQEKRK